jgi:hypothetical protein
MEKRLLHQMDQQPIEPNSPLQKTLKYLKKLGADVGCPLMRVRKTSSRAAASPFACLQALLRPRPVLRQNPGLWSPRNNQAPLQTRDMEGDAHPIARWPDHKTDRHRAAPERSVSRSDKMPRTLAEKVLFPEDCTGCKKKDIKKLAERIPCRR